MESNLYSSDENKKNFEREFSPSNIPFIEVIQNNDTFYQALFNEFVQAEIKPCFSLYLEQYYSKDELDKGFEEARNQTPVSKSKVPVAASWVPLTLFEIRIREINQEFYEKISKGLLQKKYFCPDIEKTNIVKTLKEISSVFQILKKSIGDTTTDKYKESEIRAESIIQLAKRLENQSLANEVIKTLVNDNSNIHLYINDAKENNKIFNLWEAMKNNFNTKLIESISQIPEESTINENSSTIDFFDLVLTGYCTPFERKSLSNYLFRQFKKAEKDFYNIQSFYDGCFGVIESFEKELMRKFNERKRELYSVLSLTQDPEIKEDCKNELKEISINDFSITLSGKFCGHVWNREIQSIKDAIKEARQVSEQQNTLKIITSSIKNKQMPELKKKAICFNCQETIDKLFAELKGYFPDKETNLLNALNGEQTTESLLFPHNQNKFVEVFKRLKYDGFLLSNPTEIRDWICSNFSYRKKKGNKITVEEFKKSSVYDILTKERGEPQKKERICNVEWLPYKSHFQRKSQKDIEKL